ncbi:MAG: hypothetical protein OXE94_08575 [Aestuariivita sp.]|nr:hypothetical protein [Aestuariivita sp.]MCY4202435.1 hypothetical protein [Aestuariivita sp.]MCY4287242.1 hypothetical protein [Aestuariivita sp.]MCY4345620.1 hypothetical protein [Aestuariivita sp.]
MLGAIRILAILFLALTVIYVCLYLHFRAIRREKLEAEWGAGGRVGDRDDYIRAGLAATNKSVQRWLFLGVYVVPLTLVSLLIYLTNFA